MSVLPPQTESLAHRLGRVQVGVRPELEVSRHVFRGRPSYVIQDPVTFASHHLSASDYRVFGSLTEQETLAQTFQSLVDRGHLREAQEEHFYQFVLRLHQLGLLSLPVTDIKSMYARFEQKQAARRKGLFTGILFLRVPLLNPDRFLARTVRLVAPLFSRVAVLLWALALLVSLVVVVIRREEFQDPLGTMLALQNLPIIWGLLVGLKVIHEFGHAYACRHFGGQVPEMGAIFILFTPCAYMDASASWGFSNRWHRIAVALAGVYLESIVAMISLFVWCMTGPSVLHSAAQYAVVLSTIVTIGFNINPLMRFDGYFVLSDLLSLPNLRQLATGEVLRVLKCRLFGIKIPPALPAMRDRILLCVFGVSSAIYKVTVVLGIAGIIAIKMPIAGLLLAGGYIGSTLWHTVFNVITYVACADEIAPARRRAAIVTVAGLLAFITAVLCIPCPRFAQTVGLVGRRDDQLIRAPAGAFLKAAHLQAGTFVNQGDVLCSLERPDLMTELDRAAAQVELLDVSLHTTSHPGEMKAVQRRLEQAKRTRDELGRQLAEMSVVAPFSGRVTDASNIRRIGRYLREGEPLVTISAGDWVVDALADEETISSFVPAPGDRVKLWLDGHRPAIEGRVISTDTTGTRHIEQPALTHVAGGTIPVSSDTMRADRPFFPVRIAVESPPEAIIRHGMRARVAFLDRSTTIGADLYRRLLLFVDRLRVASST